jgi:hypothetical protein
MVHRLTRILVVLVGLSPAMVLAQGVPLAPVRERGQSVTPVFEGWYRNPDGSFSLSFGYFNRNGAEILDIPLGAANFLSPASTEQNQPTRFHPRRHWGVFAVKVPADFGRKRIVWTLVSRGDSVAIPGGLVDGWQIDALEGEAGSGNTPPRLRFAADGPEGAGPAGIVAGPLTVVAGAPLPLDVWATDDGNARNSVASGGRQGVPVTLTWFKHQGPGDVTFSAVSPRVGDAGKASTTATFTAPGAYVLRVRANDASGVAGAGHSQCCWSNGFLKVTVTR